MNKCNEYIERFVTKIPRLQPIVLEELESPMQIVPYYEFFAFVIEPFLRTCVKENDIECVSILFELIEDFLSTKSEERDEAISNTVFEGLYLELKTGRYNNFMGKNTMAVWKEFLEHPF